MSNTWYNTTGTSDNITLTASTCDNFTFTGATDTSGVWFPYYQESTWMPYVETKYKPEWHIKQGYKYQIKHMWDD